MKGSVSLQEEAPETLVSLSLIGGHSKKATVYKPGKGPSPEIKLARNFS